MLQRYVEGPTLRELARSARSEEVAQAARSAGETLAAIASITFAKLGWLAPGPTVTDPLLPDADPMPRFVDRCLASPMLQRRLPAALIDTTQAAMWSRAADLRRAADQTSLVHGDFGRHNLIVRQVAGRWVVAAVLDWQFAVSGSPLADVGHFLRYERSGRPAAEPPFRAGYLDGGGRLPPGWRRLARLVDLVALCEMLTHDGLPDAAAAELVALMRGTLTISLLQLLQRDRRLARLPATSTNTRRPIRQGRQENDRPSRQSPERRRGNLSRPLCHKTGLPSVSPGMNESREAVGTIREAELADPPFDFEDLFRAQYARVTGVISRVVRDPARAEELAADAFLRLWRTPGAHGAGASGIAALRGPRRHFGWLRVPFYVAATRPSGPEGLALSDP